MNTPRDLACPFCGSALDGTAVTCPTCREELSLLFTSRGKPDREVVADRKLARRAVHRGTLFATILFVLVWSLVLILL
jgi:hypothetical protein